MKHLPLFFLFISTIRSQETNLEQKLSSEEVNARCCAQHLSCCKKPTEPTNFEVRALLVKCPKGEKTNDTTESRKAPFTSEKRKRNTKDEPHCKQDHGIVNCKRKIKLTIKVKNSGMTNCKNQYIVIDHVFDAITQEKQKLLNPYVLRIKQKPVMQSYGLSFESMVNSQAEEKVHNKQESGFTGCSVNPFKNPTCGSVQYKNEPVPFSTGFCCSCNENKSQTDKVQRNSNFSEGLRMPFPQEFSKKTRNTMELKGLVASDIFNFEGNSGNLQADPSAVNEGDITGHNEDYSRPFQIANDQKLTVFDNMGHNIQKRGGQDCNDKYTPPNLNPETYHASAHCLEFSDIWYGVYRLRKPNLHHSITIQIFEKYQDYESSCKWRDLTRNSPIEIGTSAPSFVNEPATISADYSARDINEHSFSLNYKIHKLLIPDTSNVLDLRSHPELRGGVGEYLVVKDNQVQSDGKTCNVAGVGYEAFAKQPNRCSVSKGSCLKNQPWDMWKQDHELEAVGRRGSYFLKNYGFLPPEAVTTNGTSRNKSLTIFFTGEHTSTLDVEFKADHNTVLRPSSLAIITEVYIDTTSARTTSVTAKVFNSGLVSGVFHVGLTDCPLNLPASFNNINSKPALIPPQHQHIYHLDIVCPLPKKNFFCSLQVLNDKQELIALRKIRIQRQDRCICMWYCACACFVADEGLKCRPLSLENYHAAGFQGSMPIPTHVVQYTLLDDMISMMLYILLFLCFTLLVMGLTKASVGCCLVPVGLWGLDMILDLPKKMNKYLEADLSHRTVVYDEKGWPIHPDTGERVRNIPLAAEFCTNVIFFIIYPFAIISAIIRKLCSSSYETKREEKDYDVCYCKQGAAVQRKSSSLQNSLVKKSSQAAVK